jgi:MFS superfamily sulfate permease-like transporter
VSFKPRWKVNWPALAVLIVIVVVLTLISGVAGLIAALLIALFLVVGNTGTGRWIHGGIGDDTKAANPKRDTRPRDY